jgi:hypothetical protein
MPLTRAPSAWLWLSWAAFSLAACKSQCPPLSIQEGEYCRWTRDDAGVAGSAGRAGKAGAAGHAGGAGVRAWTCTQEGDTCACVASEGTTQDGCSDPKPDCCYAYTEDDGPHCQCVPGEAAACAQLATKTAARMLTSCPP